MIVIPVLILFHMINVISVVTFLVLLLFTHHFRGPMLNTTCETTVSIPEDSDEQQEVIEVQILPQVPHSHSALDWSPYPLSSCPVHTGPQASTVFFFAASLNTLQKVYTLYMTICLKYELMLITCSHKRILNKILLKLCSLTKVCLHGIFFQIGNFLLKCW